jgi:uncharacterized protein
MSSQEDLVRAMLDPGIYPHSTHDMEKIETHISVVLLVGDYAYKIKKTVNLGFLDFSTLEARKRFCQEELRLNRRLAPSLYLEVLPIDGSALQPVLGGSGPPIEYVLKMRRFPQDQLFSALLKSGKLTAWHIDELAEKVAAFHAGAVQAREQDTFGTPQEISEPALENFRQLRSTATAIPDRPLLDSLEAWTRERLEALQGRFRQRKQAGFVRECHGDLHLGNIALVAGTTTPFDCLEFDAKLRWIDLMSEVAFVVMDLTDRERPDLAHRFLNRYLEITGDYEGLDLLRFYIVYRAMVRAKVHWLRSNQPGVGATDARRLRGQYHAYIKQAARQMQPPRTSLLITHGLSGSGKTTHTQSLLEAIGAVRVRSDVERKRMHGMAALTRGGGGVNAGIYSANSSTAAYERLLTIATAIIAAGYPAIVDAAFLKHAQRDSFRRAATALAVRFLIIDFPAEPVILRERIEKRLKAGADASDANLEVLQVQIDTQEVLDHGEMAASVTWDSGNPSALDELIRQLGSDA